MVGKRAVLNAVAIFAPTDFLLEDVVHAPLIIHRMFPVRMAESLLLVRLSVE